MKTPDTLPKFNISDTVWFLKDGKATEGVIHGLVIVRKSYDPAPEWVYRMNEGSSNTPPFTHRERELFESKKDLIDSI